MCRLSRSSGLPFALVALLLCEPANSTKALLHKAMTFLLKVATAPVRETVSTPQDQNSTQLYDGKAQMQAAAKVGTTGMEVEGLAAAGEDGVYVVTERWHAVHAFNMLRQVFTERSLSVDASGFLSAGLEVGRVLGLRVRVSVQNTSLQAAVFMCSSHPTCSRKTLE